MRLRRVSKFSKAVTKDLLPTQQATLAHVACGMLVAQCMLLGEIARSLETAVAFTHALKRVFRFGDNARLSARPDPDDLSPELTAQMKVARHTIHSLSRRLRVGPRKRLEIILDWTSCGQFQILSALVGIDGRAVPVLQWSVRKWEFRKTEAEPLVDVLFAGVDGHDQRPVLIGPAEVAITVRREDFSADWNRDLNDWRFCSHCSLLAEKGAASPLRSMVTSL